MTAGMNFYNNCYNSGGKLTPLKEETTIDMMDCDGERRIAMLVHTDSGAKRSLRKLFSPLLLPKNSKHYGNMNNGASCDAANTNKKRERDLAADTLEALEQKRRKRNSKIAMTELVSKARKISTVDENSKIFDSCPEVVQKVRSLMNVFVLSLRFQICEIVAMPYHRSCLRLILPSFLAIILKINDFIEREGASRAMLLAAIGVHGNSLRAFLQGVNQEQCTNVTYRRAYVFFEKLRITEGIPKTLRRLQNEEYLPNGFSVHKKKHEPHGLRLFSDHEFC